jgi:hypothetical protein
MFINLNITNCHSPFGGAECFWVGTCNLSSAPPNGAGWDGWALGYKHFTPPGWEPVPRGAGSSP